MLGKPGRFALAAWLCLHSAGCAVVDYEQRRWIFQPTDGTWGPGLEAARGMHEVGHEQYRQALWELFGLGRPP